MNLADLRARLPDLRARLAAIDATIIQQRTLLEHLERDRRAIYNELQSFTYPVLTLPPEITSDIFLHSLPDESQPTDPLSSPLLLRTVCKTWKNIALSTPALWATLSFDVDRLQIGTGVEGFQSIIKNWFDRAGRCPLTLILRGHIGETFLENEYIINEIVRFYASRLRNLGLHMDAKDFYALEDVGPFPLLQALTIGFPFNDSTFLNEHLLGQGVFQDTPVLRQLTLMNDAVPLSATVAWQHLTSFRGGLYTLEKCIEVLRLAPLLTDCSFCVEPGSDDYNGGIFSHPCLQVLSLVDHPDDDSTADIFKHITLPSLHTLRIEASVIDLDPTSFQSFVHRSSPPLRTFSLSGFYDDEDPFRPGSLRCMAKLTHLDLELPDMGDEWIASLLRLLANEGKDFLPELQNVCFRDCVYPVARYADMAQCLYSRWKPAREGIADLRSFKLIWAHRPTFDKATVYPLRELAAAGAIIHIGTTENNHFGL
ncbi:hypothetical protein FB451DRAFT_478594 [Mycena latifolia]|nr:hypothetical protein FB451DRAFT_478594 [Mycena latifolia]